MPDGSITALYRFAVKGLSGEALPEETLHPGRGFGHDRAFAFLRPGIPFDRAAPKPRPKTDFYMLARDADLARLKTRFAPDGETLSMTHGATHATFAIGTDGGASEAATFIARALNLPAGETPRLVRGDGHRFTDVSVVSDTFMNAVSLINLASVRDLGDKIGAPLDPMRFRGNIVFDGWPAWRELDCVDKVLAIGDARLKVLLRTNRCAATTVNPDTAARDVFVPRLLQDHYGHADCGIYAEVIEGGAIRLGDTVTLAA